MGGNSEIGETAVNLLNFKALQNPTQALEIFRVESKVLESFLQPLPGHLQSLTVAIQPDELAPPLELGEDGFTMTSQTHSTVDINASRSDVEQLERLVEEDRNVLCNHEHDQIPRSASAAASFSV